MPAKWLVLYLEADRRLAQAHPPACNERFLLGKCAQGLQGSSPAAHALLAMHTISAQGASPPVTSKAPARFFRAGEPKFLPEPRRPQEAHSRAFVAMAGT